MQPAFEVLASSGAARRGRLTTAHGVIDTPAFMPVGTYGTVKAMTPEELEALGAQIVLANTFHLMLRPGPAVIAAHGGLHRFMHWRGPILTDSGGFQVFSLQSLRKIGEEGVQFRSPLDGSEVRLSPEDSMDVQRSLASDIAMAFDDCTAYPATEAQARESMERSMRWAQRSHTHYYRDEPPGGLFGIVQGGMHTALRLASLESLQRLEWPGLAVGGLAVGESEEERLRVLEELLPHMPTERSGLRLLHLPELQPRVPASSGSLQRDPGQPPQYHPQPAFLPRAAARPERGNRGGHARRLRGGLSRAPAVLAQPCGIMPPPRHVDVLHERTDLRRLGPGRRGTARRPVHPGRADDGVRHRRVLLPVDPAATEEGEGAPVDGVEAVGGG